MKPGPDLTRRPNSERRFDRPHRPLGLRAANHAGWVLHRVRHETLGLEPEQLVEAARRQRGLTDLDVLAERPDSHVEALAALTGSLEQEADLTPVGRYFARGQIVGSLINRLELASLRQERPEIAQLELAPPLVIVGLPRSGTTFLQHLLARDPDHRVLQHWEAARPAAPRGPADEEAAMRATDRSLRLLDYLAPDARVLHPVDTREPTECVTLFSNSLASLELATMHQVPSYLAWCLGGDLSGAYDEYALQLRVLQAAQRRPRWLLKSPAHLFWLDQLQRVLPEPRLIQIHRDPLEVLGSFCSLAAVLSGISSNRVDVEALGRRWAPTWALGLERARIARRAWSPQRAVDVEYTSLVADPMGEVQRIYDHFGLELGPQARRSMEAFLGSHPQHAGGVHRYSLEQFGLDSREEAVRFATDRAEPVA